MLHPSLLSAIERPIAVPDADWAHEFRRKCKSPGQDIVDAAHFLANVQQISNVSADGTAPLIISKPQLACNFDPTSASLEDDLRPNFDQRVYVLPTSPTHSPSSSSKPSVSSPQLSSPYRPSPGSRTSQLRSLRTSVPEQSDADAASPTKYLQTDDIGPVSSAIHVLKAIARLQRHLESDRDGVVLGQLW
jgi:hypothetical protein